MQPSLVPVIMAGGLGTRLWPVSRESFPKQFIAFQSNTPSLFQQSLYRIQGLPGLQAPVVVCNEEQRFLVAGQLQAAGHAEVRILLEPEGRNTAPAVALAALEAMRDGDDPILLVLAADHVIQDGEVFQEVVKAGMATAMSGSLVTFGIRPDAPETGYGYIERGEPLSGIGFGIRRFVEKPDLVRATEYLQSGRYYWNSGMFMFRASAYLGELGRHRGDILDACRAAAANPGRDMDFIRIDRDLFQACPADSIDYAVMEKTSAGVVIPLDAGWSDLGAWPSLWQQAAKDAAGNVTIGDVCLDAVSNSYIHSDSRLVAVIGVEDAVVIETPDVVMVSTMADAQRVKQMVDRLGHEGRAEARQHRLVYRPWGCYETLSMEPGVQVKRIMVNPGASLSLQLHHHRAEHWVMVKGEARVTCGDDVFMLQENQSTFIPAQTRHRLENPGTDPIVLIEVQCGSYLGEDDIVRFEDIYGREQHQE